MVSVAVGVAGCEVRTHQSGDDGKSQRQEDRRGALAVESGPPMRGSGGVADRLRPLPVDACGLPVYRLQVYYTPDPPRVERHSASRALFVCRRPAPGLLQGCRALRSPEPRQQTHFRSLGGSLRAPRLSSPWREPEGKISFAITTDDLMNTDRIESVASKLALPNSFSLVRPRPRE